MTLQDVIDKNVDWFFVKKHEPGYNADRGECVYYDSGARRCAIGCLLSNKAAIRIQGLIATVATIIDEDDTLAAKELAGLSVSFLSNLQQAHDGTAERERIGVKFQDIYAPKLLDIIKMYNLSVPPGLQPYIKTAP